MIHLTTCLAVALAPDVLVNGIAPGLFMSRWNAGFTDEQTRVMEGKTPLGKLMTMEDLARMAVDVACNENMTAETVVVDGGLRYF
jgi:3-oxoacyl-[acyl-carrier protein] reductase